MSVASHSSTMTARHSALRWTGAALALVVAAAHLPITGEHLSEAPYIGWSFVVLEVACVALAVALTVRDSTPVWRLTTIVPALAIVAYLVTRTVTMPQIADDKGNWTEPLSFVALSAELLLVLVGLLHGSLGSRDTNRGWRLAGLVVLVLGVAATWWAASIFAG